MTANAAPLQQPRIATLRSETDADGFRQAARGLLLQGVAPDEVEWVVADGTAPELLFGAPAGRRHAGAGTDDDAAGEAGVDGGVDAEAGAGANANADAGAVADLAVNRGAAAAAPTIPPAVSDDAASASAADVSAAPAPRVPAGFLALCNSVVLHSERQRFALLYRLLWRLQREPGLRHDALDPDRAKAGLMAHAVRRDMHKMTAFVRFREVARDPGQPPLHVAWFEPQHHIVEATAPFFMRRFANMPWAILTPERCVRWNGETLEFSPGAQRQDAPPADAGEALWLTYYQHIFNPARLKLRMMEKEMPRRYWHNLPEAELISGLAADAHARSGGMLARAAVPPRRRIAAAASATAGVTPAMAGATATATASACVSASEPTPPALSSSDATSFADADVATDAATDAKANPARHANPAMDASRRNVSKEDGGSPHRLIDQATGPAWSLPPRGMAHTQAPATPPAPSVATSLQPGTLLAGAALSIPVTLHDRRDTWSAQRAAAVHCRECPLGALATQTVWGEGPLTAALMLVGEQPGDQEDLQGRPFVGPAGQLLDRALAQLHWDRSIAYVTNAVKHFKYEPRGKRRIHKTPAQREADACQHWLESEIALVQPNALVALGATAARQLLGRPVAVTRERGQWLQRADGLPVLITLHPSALLRAEPADREAGFAAWLADLRQASHLAQRAPAAGVATAPPAAPKVDAHAASDPQAR